MLKGLFRTMGVAAVSTLAIAAVIPAVASADTPSCSLPVLSQAFLEFSDANPYVLLSGQNPDFFDAMGWQLNGGAKVVPAVVQDGTLGSVLDLKSKGQAVSPVICVNSSYPDFRSMVADVAGLQGVDVQVQMYLNGAWQSPLDMGMDKNSNGSGFTASRDLQIHTATTANTVPARFILTGASNATGAAQEYQVYRVGVDPRFTW